MSALDRNFRAKAISKKPSTTFTVFNHPPDLGKVLSQLGNNANKVNGKAKAVPKPTMPKVSCSAPPSEDKAPTKREPRIGPVQEKETIAKVKAIKKVPTIPPIFDALSILLDHECGKVRSKYPKKEIAKKRKITKKNTLSQTFVEMLFKISGSKESKKWKGRLNNK